MRAEDFIDYTKYETNSATISVLFRLKQRSKQTIASIQNPVKKTNATKNQMI